VEDSHTGSVGLPTAKALRKLESITPRRSPPFDDVEMGAFIGRGDSGSVFRGSSGGGAPVAIKVCFTLAATATALCSVRIVVVHECNTSGVGGYVVTAQLIKF
jgi:hypothetical protein